MEDNDWFVSLDVTSLYTNIPHEEGMKAVLDILHEKCDSDLFPTIHSIMKLLESVLKLNNFKFNKKHFLQIQGTAMGTRVAPTYANIFMNSFEEKYVFSIRKRPKYWYRFIDDVWSIINGTEADVKEFIAYLNRVTNHIQFTATFSQEKVQFLDVWTKRDGSQICTDLYSKPTDSHSYLDYTSCHPKNTKQSIPYSQFLRVRRNCTHWTDFIGHSLQLWLHFQRRNYPITLLLESIKPVMQLTQRELLTKPVTNNCKDKQFYCIVDYNPTNPQIHKLIMEAMRFAERSSSTRPLTDTKIIFGHRKPKNIGDFLIKSDLPSEKGSKFPQKCNRFLRCRHCPRIMNLKKSQKGRIISSSTGRSYKIPKNVSCNSANLIYCLECPECQLQYVGQTKNKFLTRINQH